MQVSLRDSTLQKTEGKALLFFSLCLHLPLTDVSHRRCLVTNSSDRTLRQFILPTYPSPTFGHAAPRTESPLPSSSSSPLPIQIDDTLIVESELEPINRFNDPINKVAWHAMCFSPDGDWLAGGAADNATHKIYIWDPQNEGQFASTLDGGREPLVHVHVGGLMLGIHFDFKFVVDHLVASNETNDSLDNKPGEYPHMALPYA